MWDALHLCRAGKKSRGGMMGALCSPQSSARRNWAFVGKGSARETPQHKRLEVLRTVMGS